MKTIKEMQIVVDEVKDICKKHGVALLGVCYSEGIHGEIEIADITEIADRDIERLTNKVDKNNDKEIYVEGIGTV